MTTKVIYLHGKTMHELTLSITITHLFLCSKEEIESHRFGHWAVGFISHFWDEPDSFDWLQVSQTLTVFKRTVILWFLVDILFLHVHVLYICSFEWFNVCEHLLPVFIWVQGYTTSLALYFSRNTIKTRIWLVKGRSLLSARTLIGCVFCHSGAPRGFIFRPQWGATAAEWTSEEFHGGFTLNSFLASPIHGAGSKRLEHRDSLCVGWLWIVLRGVTGLIRRACWNISVW